VERLLEAIGSSPPWGDIVPMAGKVSRISGSYLTGWESQQ
jgi:hypothetical protein